MKEDEVALVLDFYPLVFYACHTRHVVDLDKNIKLTSNQLSLLDHLTADEPISLFDLAMHMGVTPGTMSIAVERMAKLGYIRREKDKRDGRRVNLTLSKEGERIKKMHSVLDPERVAALLKRLDEDERRRALDGLGLLAYAADMEMKAKSLSRAWNNKEL